MQVFKQIFLDIFNHMLPTIYTVRSLEPVLNCTEDGGHLSLNESLIIIDMLHAVGLNNKNHRQHYDNKSIKP